MTRRNMRTTSVAFLDKLHRRMQDSAEFNTLDSVRINEHMLQPYNLRGKVSFRCSFSGRGRTSSIRIFRVSSLINKSLSVFVKHIYKDLSKLLRSSLNRQSNVLVHEIARPSTSRDSAMTSSTAFKVPSIPRPSMSTAFYMDKKPRLLIMDRDFNKEGIAYKVNSTFTETVESILEKEYNMPRVSPHVETECILDYEVNRTLFITPSFKRHLVRKKYVWVVPDKLIEGKRGLKCKVIISLEM